VVGETSPLGRTTYYQYDKNNRLIKKTRYYTKIQLRQKVGGTEVQGENQIKISSVFLVAWSRTKRIPGVSSRNFAFAGRLRAVADKPVRTR
jgi:YD repeat-containing protein